MRIFLLLSIFLLLASSVSARDLNEYYQSDYDGFWAFWNDQRAKAISCAEGNVTSQFLSNALVTYVNAEVTEANAETIEDLAIGDPICLLNALMSLEVEKQEKVMDYFLVNPLFKDAEEISESISKVPDAKYKDIKALYISRQITD